MTDNDIFDFTGKVAIVTGGGTGVGRATGLLLAQHGADVVLASRRTELLEVAAEEIRAKGVRSLTIQTDVRREDDCERLIDRTVSDLGRLDVLINAAGGTRVAGPDGWTTRDWQAMIDLNLTSVWLLTRGAAKPMAHAGGGTVVNVSSVASFTPIPATAPYGAAKAGVNNLTAVLATEYASENIRVNGVALGMIKSEGFLKGMQMLDRDPEDQGGRILLRRPGTVEEAAYPILFLASAASTYITGETLHVGGGPSNWKSEWATS